MLALLEVYDKRPPPLNLLTPELRREILHSNDPQYGLVENVRARFALWQKMRELLR